VIERGTQLQNLAGRMFDVLVIGGGINGAASAAALSAAGAKVALVEARDFAGFTSSESSNLIWGGIKYLETLEVALVRKLCLGRNKLMRAYPEAIKETRFLAVVDRKSRFPAMFLWLGAWIYWWLGNRFTRKPRYLSRHDIASEETIVKAANLTGGLMYSDARLVDGDARFVLNLVKKAIGFGAMTINYLAVTRLQREPGGTWTATVVDGVTGRELCLQARFLVNAAGPFADELNRQAQFETSTHHVFSKGIHLVVDRITDSNRVLTFFADDGRMFFAIPLGDKTCIGTTDTPVESPLTRVSDADRKFVLDNINNCLNLATPLTKDDILAERCGVRPLAMARSREYKTGQWLQMSRKHVLQASEKLGMVSIFGGKLTDCLQIGGEVCGALSNFGCQLQMGKWYGEPGLKSRDRFAARLREVIQIPEQNIDLPWDRLWRMYGVGAIEILESILSENRGAELVIRPAKICRAELELIRNQEMVVTLEDFLRRRTLLAQTHGLSELASMPGIRAACEVLFGNQAEQRYEEYFQMHPPIEIQSSHTNKNINAKVEVVRKP